MGSDALLLIVADLSGTQLAELHEPTLSLGMDMLADAGDDDALVGEALVTAGDPIKRLLGLSA